MLVILVCLTMFLGKCTKKTQDLQQTIVSGTIENHTNYPNNQFIELILNNPFQDQTHLTEFLDSSGAFKFEFNRIYPQEVLLKYKYGWNIYLFPGDSVHLLIDANLLKTSLKKRKDYFDYIQIKGGDERFSQDFIKFQCWFYDSLFKFWVEKDSITYLDHTGYRTHIERRKERYFSAINDFNRENKTSKKFKKWVCNRIEADALNDLMRYSWIHPIYNKYSPEEQADFKLPQEYFSFLEKKGCFDENMMTTLWYFYFLWEYYIYLNRYMIPQELLEQRTKLAQAGDQTAANKTTRDFIIQNVEEFERQVLLTTFYDRLLEWKFIDVFEALFNPELIERNDYCQLLISKYEALKASAEHPTFLDDTELYESRNKGESDILKVLKNKYQGKVIYIDFWAPWCGPCMGEMPYSKKIQETFKYMDVVFVFLASRCSEDSWKATISQNELTGRHYLLSDEQYANLSDRFEISGIPHYLLVDKEGMVVNDDAPRPSEEKVLFKEIDKLLK